MVLNTRVKPALSRKQVGEHLCQTPVSNFKPVIHTSLTPELNRQNSTREAYRLDYF
jgi:hypothetical protein